MWLHRKKGGIEDPVSLPTYSKFVEFGLDTTMTNVSAQGQDLIVTGHTTTNKLITTLTVKPNSGYTGTYNVLVTKDGNDFASGSVTNSDLQLNMNLSNGTYKVLITVSEEFIFGTCAWQI